MPEREQPRTIYDQAAFTAGRVIKSMRKAIQISEKDGENQSQKVKSSVRFLAACAMYPPPDEKCIISSAVNSNQDNDDQLSNEENARLEGYRGFIVYLQKNEGFSPW